MNKKNEMLYVVVGIVFGFLYSLLPMYINVIFTQKIVEYLSAGQFAQMGMLILFSLLGIVGAELLYGISEYRIKPVLRLLIQGEITDQYVMTLGTMDIRSLNNERIYKQLKLVENSLFARKMELYDNVIGVVLNCSALITLVSFLAKQNFLITIGVLCYALLMRVVGRWINKKNFSFDMDIQEELVEKELLAGFYLLPEYGEFIQDKRISNTAITEYKGLCDKLTQKYHTFFKRVFFTNTIVLGGSNTLIGVLSLLVLGYMKICRGLITVAQFLAYYRSVELVMGNIDFLINGFNQIHLSYQYVQHNSKIMKREPGVTLQDYSDMMIREAGVAFGEKKVFENITMSICKGDKVAVIGRNGCGKSTLLKSMCNIQELSTGEIWINGEKMPDRLRPAIYVPAENVFFTWEKYEDDFFEQFVENSGYDNAEVLVGRVKQFLEHEMLSEGEKKILMLMHAFSSGVELLLLDEPLSNLDSDWKEMVLDLILKSRRTVVFVTHDGIDEHMCTKVIKL